MNNVIVRINGNKKSVKVSGNSKVLIDKRKYTYELTHLQNSTYLLKINNRFFRINYLEKETGKFILSVNGEKFTSSAKSLLKEKAEEIVSQDNLEHEAKLLKAPMPGMVLEISVKIGDKVKQGDNLLILEAMKMENSIKSSFTGIVKEIYIDKNNPVEKGTKLLLIA